jgi:hypothetical protein
LEPSTLLLPPFFLPHLSNNSTKGLQQGAAASERQKGKFNWLYCTNIEEYVFVAFMFTGSYLSSNENGVWVSLGWSKPHNNQPKLQREGRDVNLARMFATDTTRNWARTFNEMSEEETQ